MATTGDGGLKVPRDDIGIDAMMTLVRDTMGAVASSQATTLNGLDEELRRVVFSSNRHKDIGSGAEFLRLRLMNSAPSGTSDFNRVRDAMVKSCQSYLNSANTFYDATVNYVLPFIRDTSVVVAHGNGALLAHCIAASLVYRTGVRFLVTENLPEDAGRSLVARVKTLPSLAALEQRLGTAAFEALYERSVTTIPDASVASLMHEVSFVICGANAVTEHGGLVHSAGSLQLAIVAEALRVPFYVLCESFKFSSIFPLSTADLYASPAHGRRGIRSALSASTLAEPDTPEPQSSNASSPTKQTFGIRGSQSPSSANFNRVGSFSSFDGHEAAAARAPVALLPVVLVPPRLVSLIFSEEGIMPPSAVADQMLVARRAMDSKAAKGAAGADRLDASLRR